MRRSSTPRALDARRLEHAARLAFVALVACALLVATGCDEPASDPPSSDEPAVAPEGPHPLFAIDPRGPQGPWPDDRLRLAAGGPALPDAFENFLPTRARTPQARALVDSWSEQLARSDGFGTYAGALLRFSEPVEFDSLAETVRIVRLGDAPQSVALELHDAGYQPLIVAAPSQPLKPGTRHALLVRAGARAASGADLVPSPEFFAWSRGEGRDTVAEIAAAAGVPAEELLVATVFTTGTPDAGLRSAAAAVSAPAAPTVTERHASDDPALASLFGGSVPPGVGEVVLGTFPSRDLRGADGSWDPALVAAPDTAPAADVPFLLVRPEGSGPHPVVLVLHGIGGSREYGLDVAPEFVAIGHAVLAIDASSHGARGAAGALFDLGVLVRTRDHFRQTPFDLVQLHALVAAGRFDVDGEPGPELAPEGTVFFGNSMGGIMGASFTAVTPAPLGAAVLNVGGGGLTRMLQRSNLELAIRILLSGKLDLDHQDPDLLAAMPILLAVAQQAIDAGDPISFGAALQAHPERAVLLQEAVGDQTIPNVGSEALARALGLEETSSAADTGRPLRVIAPVDPMGFDSFPPSADPHDLYGRLPEARLQAARFLASGGRELCEAHAGCAPP